MMQKELNEKYYLTTQKRLRGLALKSSQLSYGELINEFNLIKEYAIWSNWGMHGHLTKKALIEYLEILNNNILKGDKSFKFLGVYLFNKEVKNHRERMHKNYIKDFKE